MMRINLLILLLTFILIGCTQSDKRTTITADAQMMLQPTQTPTYEEAVETSVVSYRARLHNSVLPDYPHPPSCLIPIPENEYAAWGGRMADWASAQIVAGDFTQFTTADEDTFGVHVFANGDGVFLATWPLLECDAGPHSHPGSTVYIIDQSGDYWRVIDRVGLPFPAQETRVHWDGEQWITMTHQQDLYWGTTTTPFTVWHIFETADGWDSIEFELPETPELSRAVSGWNYGQIQMGADGETVVIGSAPHSYDCGISAEQWATHRYLPAKKFRFDGLDYTLIGLGYSVDGNYVECTEVLDQ